MLAPQRGSSSCLQKDDLCRGEVPRAFAIVEWWHHSWGRVWFGSSSPRLSPIKLPEGDLKDAAEWCVLVYSASYFQSHIGWVQSFTWLHIRRAGVLAQGFTILCRLVLGTIFPGTYKQGRLKTHLTELRPHQGFLRNGGTSVAPCQIPIKAVAPGKNFTRVNSKPKD